MLSVFPYEALIKSLVTFLGPILLLIGGFLYGIHQANKSAKLAQLDEEKKIQHNVNNAERENQDLEAKKNEDLNKVRDTSVVSDLIKLWNEKGWGPKG